MQILAIQVVILSNNNSLKSSRTINAGINLTGYHSPRADPRASNFFRQNPRPRDSFSVQNSGPRVGKTKQKSPPPGITCQFECQEINEKGT